MPEASEAEVRRSFFKHLGLAAVTLGLYMPVWLVRREAQLREVLGGEERPSAAWALGAGMALGFVGQGFFGAGSPNLALAFSLFGVGLFGVGFYLVVWDLDRASRRLGLDPPSSPVLSTGVLALAFAGVELGNRFESWLVRGLALVAVLVLPYVFWRLHVGVWALEAARPEEPEEEAAGA